MKIIVAIDSFKGCMTSSDANEAARHGIVDVLPQAEVVTVPVSDGGEGWIEAFRRCGDESVTTEVLDPLGRPIEAQYLRRNDTAIIEIAEACGLQLLTPEERNPLAASSYGVGQIIADALNRGARNFIVGLGGSATSDAGRGMMEALSQITIPQDSHFTIATDVVNPLCGPDGAAAIFAPQKGATPEMVKMLDEQARAFAQEAAAKLGFDRSHEPGAGAAGGLGYAFMQFLNAKRCSGIDLLLDSTDFESIIADADLIITGEGHADRQTLMGKVPFGILRRAKKLRIPTILIAGRVDDREALLDAGFAEAIDINKKGLPFEETIKHDAAVSNIKETVSDFLIHVLKQR